MAAAPFFRLLLGKGCDSFKVSPEKDADPIVVSPRASDGNPPNGVHISSRFRQVKLAVDRVRSSARMMLHVFGLQAKYERGSKHIHFSVYPRCGPIWEVWVCQGNP